ncbi:MAG TPA: hypothetical protein VHO48_09160, partial [Anaerolineaceae bacterium]|nr:hypothetical protein [Anaerolineaceae bacterium]
STQGHTLAATSPLQSARVADTPRRLQLCRAAIRERDFSALAEVVEQDSNVMHAVMMTSNTPLFYWEPPSLALIKAVRAWRNGGMPVCATLDAGPNVHVITTSDHRAWLEAELLRFPGVQRVLCADPGGPAHLVKA